VASKIVAEQFGEHGLGLLASLLHQAGYRHVRHEGILGHFLGKKIFNHGRS